MGKALKLRTVPCLHCQGTGRRTDPVALGQHLRDCREAKGIGLRKIAQLLKCSPTHVSDIELGKRSPGPDLLRRYREAVA